MRKHKILQLLGSLVIPVTLTFTSVPTTVYADNGQTLESEEESGEEDTSEEKSDDVESDDVESSEETSDGDESDDKASDNEASGCAEDEDTGDEASEAVEDEDMASEEATEEETETETATESSEYNASVEYGNINLMEDMSEDEINEQLNEMLLSYFESGLYGKRTTSAYRARAYSARNSLDDDCRLVYDAAKEQLAKVAKGEENDTIVCISVSKSYNVDEMTKIYYALLRDCPSEMYWHNFSLDYEQNPKDNPTELLLGFSVDSAYRKKNDYIYATDNSEGSKIQAANTAITYAKTIVEEAKNKSDYDKLLYYANQLCDMNTYNSSASLAESSDPWQIIYMFDNNPDTKVECEGYAKSFQYLCDMTEFNDDNIICYSVAGTFSGDDRNGNHLWNIVRMDDGNNYLVDITNMDQDKYENDYYIEALFLGTPIDGGSIDTGYTISFEYFNDTYNFKYVYDDTTKSLYSEKDLTLSSSKYKLPVSEPDPTPDPEPTPKPEPDSNDDSEQDDDSNDEAEQYSGATLSGAVPVINTQPIIEAVIGETSIGWDSFSYEADKAESNDLSTLNVYMNGADTIPTEVMSTIADNDLALNILVDTNTMVTIDGSQFTKEEASDVKLITGKSEDGDNTLGVRSQNTDILKSMIIYPYVGTEYVGSETALYFVNADNSLIEFRNSIVYDSGFTAYIAPLVNANYKSSIKKR
jgi:hypothetical protein